MSDIKINFKSDGLKKLEEVFLQQLDILAVQVQEEAKRLVPVDTGALRDSIEVFEGNEENERLIGSKTIPYAIYQEVGTPKIKKQPYLRPALDHVVSEFKRSQGH
jgi:HK97 gp10 family phage protein